MTNEGAAAQEEEEVKTTQINTMGGGVQIGSNDPNVILSEITDDDDRRGALMFLKDQQKKEKFRDRLATQLDNVKRQAHHTRAKIRIKFPDGYILQGTFGAKEKVAAVIEFVKQSIVHKDRPFYLFETPPKRVLSKMNQTLIASRMVPSCLLYFGREGLDETKIGDGPFIDISGLREHVVQL